MKFSFTFVIIALLIINVGVSSSLFTFQLMMWYIQQDIQDKQVKQLVQHDVMTERIMNSTLVNSRILNLINNTSNNISDFQIENDTQ